jgi:hypothetical protein
MGLDDFKPVRMAADDVIAILGEYLDGKLGAEAALGAMFAAGADGVRNAAAVGIESSPVAPGRRRALRLANAKRCRRCGTNAFDRSGAVGWGRVSGRLVPRRWRLCASRGFAWCDGCLVIDARAKRAMATVACIGHCWKLTKWGRRHRLLGAATLSPICPSTSHSIWEDADEIVGDPTRETTQVSP